MNIKKRRQCYVLGECLTFQKYEEASQNISETFDSIADNTCEEGIKMLNKLTDQFMRSIKQGRKSANSQDMSTSIAPTVNIEVFDKKQLIQDEPPFLQKTNRKQNQYQRHTTRSKGKEMGLQLQKGKRMTELQKLSESLKKMEFAQQDQHLPCFGVDQNTDYINEPTQSLQEFIEESNAKVKKSAERRFRGDPFYDENASDVEYPLTDYSSNQSSNDVNHDEEVVYDFPPENYQSIVNLPTYSQNSQKSLESNNYQASKILYSPKKVFINKKRVPRWAADTELLRKVVRQQRNDPKFDPIMLYGTCVVQHLDTNVIFSRQDMYFRGSSARWVKSHYKEQV